MRASRLFVPLGILVIGVVSALPFRQAPAERLEVQPPAVVPVALPIRRQESPLELAQAQEISPASGFFSASERVPETPKLPSASDVSAERLNVAPPPAMPIAFQPIAEGLKPTSWKPKPPVDIRPKPKPRPYRLRDGDTLEGLAERFLGDRLRAEEIFEGNRQLLERPDLLPVGKEILLPARDHAVEVERARVGEGADE